MRRCAKPGGFHTTGTASRSMPCLSMRLFMPHPYAFLAASALTAMLAACDPPAPRAVAEIETDTEVLYFEPIGRGNRAQLTDTTRVVVRDSATWAQLHPQFDPLVPFQAVDFRQAMVIAVAVPAPTAGYLVEVTAVEQAGDSLLVTYTRTRPGDDCATALGRTVPFEVVLARRAEGTAVFREEIAYLACDLGGPF